MNNGTMLSNGTYHARIYSVPLVCEATTATGYG